MFESNLWDKKENLAIEFLNRKQQNDGSFLSKSSPSPDSFTHSLTFHSVFSTALIMQSLSQIEERKSLLKMKKKGISFLLSQKSKNWSWNYWTRDSNESKKIPYPDDLDDTSCSLAAIFLYDKSLITGKALAYITQLLTTLELQEGGPYRTWLVDESADEIWRDCDIVVNANIAYFLSLSGVRLKNLTQMFDTALKENTFDSPYYPNPYPFLYFLSRTMLNKSNCKLLETIILKHTSKAMREPLFSALSLLALHQINSPKPKLEKLAEVLWKTQQKNGSWKASVFYTGVNPDHDRMFYAGSESLTTAFCLLALERYRKTFTKKRKKKNNSESIYKKVEYRVISRFSELGPFVKKEAIQYAKKILDMDKDKQITLLPYFAQISLGEKGQSIPEYLIVKLGAASVYGWIAYTIYDNFLDEESDIPSLPVANICLRELTTIFTTILSKDTGFPNFFKTTMDQLEEANTWEVINTRNIIPDYGDLHYLADRSLGHVLGSIVLLISAGYSIDSNEVNNFLTFFYHFLIARQLNDDLHDWEKDLGKGQINSVGALVLKEAGTRKKTDLQKIFWNKTVDNVCGLVENHVNKAKKVLEKNTAIVNKEFFISLIQKQENTIVITRKEKRKTLEFLAIYK